MGQKYSTTADWRTPFVPSGVRSYETLLEPGGLDTLECGDLILISDPRHPSLMEHHQSYWTDVAMVYRRDNEFTRAAAVPFRGVAPAAAGGRGAKGPAPLTGQTAGDIVPIGPENIDDPIMFIMVTSDGRPYLRSAADFLRAFFAHGRVTSRNGVIAIRRMLPARSPAFLRAFDNSFRQLGARAFVDAPVSVPVPKRGPLPRPIPPRGMGSGCGMYIGEMLTHLQLLLGAPEGRRKWVASDFASDRHPRPLISDRVYTLEAPYVNPEDTVPSLFFAPQRVGFDAMNDEVACPAQTVQCFDPAVMRDALDFEECAHAKAGDVIDEGIVVGEPVPLHHTHAGAHAHSHVDAAGHEVREVHQTAVHRIAEHKLVNPYPHVRAEPPKAHHHHHHHHPPAHHHHHTPRVHTHAAPVHTHTHAHAHAHTHAQPQHAHAHVPAPPAHLHAPAHTHAHTHAHVHAAPPTAVRPAVRHAHPPAQFAASPAMHAAPMSLQGAHSAPVYAENSAAYQQPPAFGPAFSQPGGQIPFSPMPQSGHGGVPASPAFSPSAPVPQTYMRPMAASPTALSAQATTPWSPVPVCISHS